MPVFWNVKGNGKRRAEVLKMVGAMK